MGRISRSKIVQGRLLEGDTREGIVKAVRTVYPEVDAKKVLNQIAPTVAAMRKRGYILTTKENTLKMVKEEGKGPATKEKKKDVPGGTASDGTVPLSGDTK